MLNEKNLTFYASAFSQLFTNITALEDSKFVMPYQKTISNNDCQANKFDKYQYCLCQSGQRISEFKSHHNNRREDRIWQLKCAPIQAKLYIPSKDSKKSGYTKTSRFAWSDLKRSLGSRHTCVGFLAISSTQT